MPPRLRPAERLDLAAAAVATGLVVVAMVVGAVLTARGVPLRVNLAPLAATWSPGVGPGTPFALGVAVLAVACGPVAAHRLSWGRLLLAAALGSLAWTTSLALVRGGREGVAGRLSSRYEYLAEVPDAPPWRELVGGFVERVPTDAPDAWATHVAGHPPGALAVFVALDRAGLGGGAWASVLCLLAVASVPVAVAVVGRRLGGEAWTRRALPFVVLLPAVVWAGVSADGLFAAVGAWGLVLLVLASERRSTVLAVAAGVVLGSCLFLSYGLVLVGLPALAVLVHRRAFRVAVVAGLAVSAVVALWALAGFAWWDGLDVVRGRYLDGYGGERPYGYWVWANVAALVVAVGPAVVAALRRVLVGGAPPGVRLLLASMLAALAMATLSGMSKAEVERIWLPWSLWLPLACAALPAGRVRWWLAGQAAVALLVEHLLATPW